jgi:hypothetical protein
LARAWTEAFHGRSSSAVRAGVAAGLAVAALSYRVAPAGTIDVSVRFQLAPLRPSDIVLHAELTDIGSRDIPRARSPWHSVYDFRLMPMARRDVSNREPSLGHGRTVCRYRLGGWMLDRMRQCAERHLRRRGG